ncbi:hypothetical protein POSPLADRAFT_1040384 [Postia placenta MAD-698-R-SB12]|uniref:Uncharacterized protein n=1 Tax=Postia placenta MAD-698-R-SB12 TaxID=670580 RepID=A0A1X6MXW5_9APHY|nr:hypothetical protein POSPLADRAFT_1040384 [Postia placenta MAD-698-R-SB12]OSX61177.1 hypothetical protein POSPLADRAFT_1040384 [Postia placenta MAD-698-R-SB12]
MGCTAVHSYERGITSETCLARRSYKGDLGLPARLLRAASSSLTKFVSFVYRGAGHFFACHYNEGLLSVHSMRASQTPLALFYVVLMTMAHLCLGAPMRRGYESTRQFDYLMDRAADELQPSSASSWQPRRPHGMQTQDKREPQQLTIEQLEELGFGTLVDGDKKGKFVFTPMPVPSDPAAALRAYLKRVGS